MPGFIDRARWEASKAAFEADRLLRLRRVDSAMDGLRGQIQQLSYQIGNKAIELSKAGPLDPLELAPLLEQVRQLEQEIANKEAEKARIKQEAPPPPPESAPVVPVAPTPRSALYGHICLKCQIELPPEAKFCPKCGGPVQDVAPPATPPPAAGTACVQCGTAVPPGAAFCPLCGGRVESLAPDTEAPALPVCKQCGKPLPPGAVFCGTCGARLEAPASASPEPPPAQ
jgi:ribosomal protein L40E